MNCPRCKKDFTPENLSFFKWLETSGLDALQTAFVICSYGRPMCDECLETLKNGFYTCEINPCLKFKSIGHDKKNPYRQPW